MRIISLLAISLIVFSAQSIAQDDKETVLETVSKRGVEAKLKFLASDEMRGRQTPSPELNTAAKYLETHMYGHGVEMAPGMTSYMQRVPLVEFNAPTGGSLTMGDSIYGFDNEMLLLGGSSATLKGATIFLDYGTKEDFDGADVKGKIVIVKSGEKGESGARKALMMSGDKATMAQEAGAIGLVELYVSPQPNWKIMRYYLGSSRMSLAGEDSGMDDFPRIWLDDVSGAKKPFLEAFEGEATMTIEGAELKRFDGYNVIGVVPGTDSKLKDEYIAFSAHYDHVGVGELNADGDSIFNGTRDNAIGTVTVMEAVTNIAKYPLKRSSLFIFFTAEEKGLLGSEYYVNHPIVPLEQTMMSYNCDNGGYNDTTFAMIVGLERVTAAENMTTGCEAFGLEAKPDQVLDQNLYQRSDHYSFAQKGVPGVMFGMGATDFGEGIMKYLHQQADNPNTIDYNYLYKFSSSYVYGGRLIGNAKKSPTWTKGDDYAKKGKELYGK